jgi:hypothetical protein
MPEIATCTAGTYVEGGSAISFDAVEIESFELVYNIYT